MALPDAACRTAKGRAGDDKLSDGGGLYLFAKPNGARVGQQADRFAGKQKKLAYQPYPLISLTDARRLRNGPKGCSAPGVDPGAHKAAIAPSGDTPSAEFGQRDDATLREQQVPA